MAHSAGAGRAGLVAAQGRGGAGGGPHPPRGAAATAQAWADSEPRTRPGQPSPPRPPAPPRPPLPGLGLSRRPVARPAPPPPTSGHVPRAARATHGGALNLSPPGAELEAGAARRRAVLVAGGGGGSPGLQPRGAEDDLLPRLPAGQLSARGGRPGGGAERTGRGRPHGAAAALRGRRRPAAAGAGAAARAGGLWQPPRRRLPPVAGGGGGQDHPLRVRAAAVPLRGALGGGPEAAGLRGLGYPGKPAWASLFRDGTWSSDKLALKGSSYSGLLERHHIHTKNVEHILDSLRNEGIEVRLVKRREYDEEIVRWADAVIAAGGDGTMLLAASKVLDRLKPVIGVNTDPERSEGHLCLPVRYTHSFPEALQKFYRGEFRWLWRQRIRLYLEGTGINPVPVDLHEQQLSLNQHSRAFNIERVHDERPEASGPQLLPVRALNEVFIGESLSSRASYYEISVDDGPWEKQKSSGLNLCTGTGSKAWSFNINRVATQAVEDVLNIAKRQGNLSLPLNRELVEKVTNEYNESLLYSPEEPKILFSIREPIANRVFSSSRQRCFTSKVCVRSRCWDACMVVDGGTSFEFNDGAIASMMIDKEDELRTVLLEQ
uniref:NAD(+) kinase n=3 Tax=Canidae TaxID=9608 RepID=A0A8C0QQC4_CANLF